MEPLEHPTQQNDSSLMQNESQYPSLLKRVQSIFIDGLLLLVFMFSIGIVLGDIEALPGAFKGFMFIAFWVLYEPLCIAYGCTLGNYIMGIRVRSVKDETQRISLLQSFVRVIVKSILGWLSFLSIHFNEHRRAVHDLAAGSVMVEMTKD